MPGPNFDVNIIGETPLLGAYDIVPKFPSLSIPALPTIQIPALPTIQIPALPNIQIPAMPSFKIPALPNITIPKVPDLNIPDIPALDLTDLGVQPLDILSPQFWGIPSINLNENGEPLSNNNQFIQFADVNDKVVGSIRAVSIKDWEDDYLNPLFLYTLYSAITESPLDKIHSRYHFYTEITKALKDYAKIGVEYSSGNGDYAEWLERKDHSERINPGDIVAVTSGKISRSFENAEQFMVISHKPIVLGNIPPEDQIQNGNNVAFMGQVPVKTMGPVTTGDYIIAHPEIKGYGFAKHPEMMSPQDLIYTVGRAWETNSNEGPKMVNTVVGIHNGDYSKILMNYEKKFRDTEERLKSLEARMESLSEILVRSKNESNER